jgi:hypothetical protein
MRIKKNGKTINLTESDLKRIVKKTLNEEMTVWENATIKFACQKASNSDYKVDLISQLKMEIDGKEVHIILDNKASENDKAIVGAFCKKR